MKWYRCTVGISADSFSEALRQAEEMVREQSFRRDGNVRPEEATLRLDGVERTNEPDERRSKEPPW